MARFLIILIIPLRMTKILIAIHTLLRLLTITAPHHQILIKTLKIILLQLFSQCIVLAEKLGQVLILIVRLFKIIAN